MKTMKKLFALIMALAMVMALAVTVSADNAPQTGTITIENATKNQEYKAYKIFNAYVAEGAEGEAAKVSYTIDADKKDLIDENAPFVVGLPASDGGFTITVKEGVEDAAILEWINANAKSFDEVEASKGQFNEANSTYTFTGIEFGYYFITSGMGAAVTIDTLGPTATFQDKNYNKATDPEKVITAIDGDTKNITDAQVGSVVSFRASFEAVNWAVEDGLETALSKDKVTPVAQTVYTVKDTPTNMTIDANSVKITVNGQEITNFTFENNTFTIPWATDLVEGKWGEGSKFLYAPEAGKQTIPVVITYDAKVLAAAADNGAGNAIGDSTTSVDLYKFQLDKVKSDYSLLTGAKFQLKDAEGNLIKFTKDANGEYIADKDGTIDTIDLTENATAVIKGLKKGTYTLVETQVPGGYNKADDQTVDESVLKKYDEDITDAEDTNEGDDGVVSVVNNMGVELPSTGGIGTTIFTVVGAALMIGAAVLFITKKRTVID